MNLFKFGIINIVLINFRTNLFKFKLSIKMAKIIWNELIFNGFKIL